MPESKINMQNRTSCSIGVGNTKCADCSEKLIRYGKTKNGKQRYYCQNCLKSRVLHPRLGYENQFDKQIIQLTNEGLGIRSTARVLGIAPSTVIRKILMIASNIEEPKISNRLGRIQVDELYTIVQNKKRAIYVIYSWSQEMKQVLSLAVGTRSKVNLRKVVIPLLEAGVEAI